MGLFNVFPETKQITSSSGAESVGGESNNMVLPNAKPAKVLVNQAGNWLSAMTVDLILDMDFELHHLIVADNFNNNRLRCMFGISSTRTPNSTYPTFSTLRNSIYIESNSSVEIYENNAKVFDGDGITCNIGDVFTIKSVNGRITYLKNNVEFYKSTMGPIGAGWIPTICGGDMGEYNIYGGDKISVFESGHTSTDSQLSTHLAFTKIRPTTMPSNVNVVQGSTDFAYLKNINLNGKLKINGNPSPDIARKGYRPNATALKWSATTKNDIYKIFKDENGDLRVNDTIISSAQSDTKSFFILCVGGGGGGGKATGSIVSAWSGGGGGSGAYFWANVTLKPNFVGQVARIDVVQSSSSGGHIYYNWRDSSGNFCSAGAGGRGGDGANAGSGKGTAGKSEYGGNFDTDSVGEFTVINSGNGLEGRPARPKDYTNNSDMPSTTLTVYMPETLSKTIGGFASGTAGDQNEAGPGAGGYLGKGGDAGDVFGDGFLGGAGETSAGSGGADSKWNWNSGRKEGGPSYVGIYF